MHTTVKSNSFFACIHIKQFQFLPLNYSTDVRWRFIYRGMLHVAVAVNAPATSRQANVVFQHVGVAPHIHSELTTFLTWQLPEEWIDRGGSTSWPPRSPSLTSLNFFPWNLVKILPVPVTLNNLKDRIRTGIAKK
jgi:hypothetical protein